MTHFQGHTQILGGKKRQKKKNFRKRNWIMLINTSLVQVLPEITGPSECGVAMLALDCGPFQLWPRLQAVPPHWTKQETEALCERDIINKQRRFCCSWEVWKVDIWRISIRTHELLCAVSYSRISKSDSHLPHYRHVNRLLPRHLRITVQYSLRSSFISSSLSLS